MLDQEEEELQHYDDQEEDANQLEDWQAILEELADEETWHYFFGDDDYEDVRCRQDPQRYGGYLETEWVMSRNYLTEDDDNDWDMGETDSD